MTNGSYDIIFIAGAPGTGKSSVAQKLQKKLKSPCFEFDWIPEFRFNGRNEITYIEEECIAFENLVLVIKNYLKHGFKNIIITDLEDKRIVELDKHFSKMNYLIFTLTLADDNIQKSRILNKTRSSKYRDWKTGIKINSNILKRPLVKNEIRIDVTTKTLTKVVNEIIFNILKKI